MDYYTLYSLLYLLDVATIDTRKHQVSITNPATIGRFCAAISTKISTTVGWLSYIVLAIIKEW